MSLAITPAPFNQKDQEFIQLLSKTFGVKLSTLPETSQLASLVLSKTQELFYGVDPLLPKQITRIYKLMFLQEHLESIFKNCLEDKYHVALHVHLLFHTLISINNIQADDAPMSSNEALFLKAIINNKVIRTYVYKPTQLRESFGVPSKEGAKREQLAYLLDEDHFAGVPPTFFVDFSKVGLKVGSVQYYEHNCVSLDSINSINNKVDILALRRIILHDLIIVNLDVSYKNVLIKNKQPIPIDHGYCLPSQLFSKPTPGGFTSFDAPLTEQEKIHIQHLCQENISTLLFKHKIDEPAIRLQHIMLQILKCALDISPAPSLNKIVDFLYSGPEVGGGWSGIPYHCLFPTKLMTIIKIQDDLERESIIKRLFLN